MTTKLLVTFWFLLACTATPPLVTFVIPSKGRLTLRRTLESIYNQSDDGWRVIIVCDGLQVVVCPDIQESENTSVIFTEKNLGVDRNSAGAVRNVGLSYVTTPWAGFVDDDDTVSFDYVRHLRNDSRRHPQVKTIIFRMMFENRRILPPPEAKWFVKNRVGISFAVNMQMMWSNNMQFIPSRIEDFDLLHRILQIPNLEMLMSSHVAYYVRHARRASEPNEKISESVMVGGLTRRQWSYLGFF